MRPDLSDPAARAAYKSELRALARGSRLLGFALVVLGVAALFTFRAYGIEAGGARAAAWGAIAAGWMLFAYAIVRRTRHHKARMAEEPARR